MVTRRRVDPVIFGVRADESDEHGQVQKLGGWKSPAMVARYAKMSTAQLAKTSNIIDDVMPAAPKKLKLVVNQ